MSQRVVITGLGVCTPLGRETAEFWSNLLAGRSGIGPVTLFDARSFPVRIGGEVKSPGIDHLAAIFPEARGERDRKVWFGLDAVFHALADAGLHKAPLREALLLVGVSLETFFVEQVISVAHTENPAAALARYGLSAADSFPLQTPLDRTTQLIGDHYGLNGGRYTNCSACAAGAQAIGDGFRRVRSGAATIALAGATDSVLNPLGLGGFGLLGILSNENDQPEKACRPFDATRQGTVLGEGAGFVVLEALEHARGRGARIYAEVLGYGSSMDAFRVTDPEPTSRGASLSMARALADAGLAPEAVDCINAHGTGTLKNDIAESLAIKKVFGPKAFGIPVTANKSMTGHLIAASGAVEAAAAVLTISTKKVPPTINLAHPDPACDLDYVPGVSREFYGRTVLSNSFGFGGQNATLLFQRFDL